MVKHTILGAALVALLAVPAAAQKAVTIGDVVTATFTIEAIDHTSRVVTLKKTDGTTQDIYCGPDVQRFDALKVGDKVTFRYHETLVSMIQRPGGTPKPAVTGAVTRTPGMQPGGTIATQMTIVVTLEAIDEKVGSITIRTEDGRRLSAKVADPKNLAGYKAGDKVEVTYTQALAISVQPAK
jgi:Cu/Ag efflux protein CusF